jgi:hypothetical protein
MAGYTFDTAGRTFNSYGSPFNLYGYTFNSYGATHIHFVVDKNMGYYSAIWDFMQVKSVGYGVKIEIFGEKQ